MYGGLATSAEMTGSAGGGATDPIAPVGGGGGGGRYGGNFQSPGLAVCCEVFLEPSPLELERLSGDGSSGASKVDGCGNTGTSSGAVRRIWRLGNLVNRGLITFDGLYELRMRSFSSRIASSEGSSWLESCWRPASPEPLWRTELRSLK